MQLRRRDPRRDQPLRSQAEAIAYLHATLDATEERATRSIQQTAITKVVCVGFGTHGRPVVLVLQSLVVAAALTGAMRTLCERVSGELYLILLDLRLARLAVWRTTPGKKQSVFVFAISWRRPAWWNCLHSGRRANQPTIPHKGWTLPMQVIWS